MIGLPYELRMEPYFVARGLLPDTAVILRNVVSL